MPKMKVLYRASRAIRRFPESSNQRVWHESYGDETPALATAQADEPATVQPPCGTSLCQAGWIAYQNAPEGAKLSRNYIIYPDGSTETIETFAKRTAGLTDGQAEAMFIHTSNIDEVDAMIDLLEIEPDATERQLRNAADKVSGITVW